MQRLLTVFHLVFTLLFAVAGIWLLIDPITLIGKQMFYPPGTLVAAQQTAFGLLLAAGISLYVTIRSDSRTILHPLLCLYLAGLSISFISADSAAPLWLWIPLAVYLLPLIGLLPLRMPAGPLKAGQLQGQVKWFNPNKGYGFILSDDGQEIFVHFRAVHNGDRRTLRQGQKVRFSIRQSERGDQADDVHILD
ncbi:cold-shock protein [Alcanivorax sp. 1008]|uniref:cold-shock protein n=1 Tax=Alcanivorax sp. 1008 TaxID=2816853 RepID=UPI0027150038|nr:cold shock domain-containing protein [Alcanivorax sp. 1008]